jgi:hypothetical protein
MQIRDHRLDDANPVITSPPLALLALLQSLWRPLITDSQERENNSNSLARDSRL